MGSRDGRKGNKIKKNKTFPQTTFPILRFLFLRHITPSKNPNIRNSMSKIEEEYCISEQTPVTITDTSLISSSPTPRKSCLDGARCRTYVCKFRCNCDHVVIALYLSKLGIMCLGCSTYVALRCEWWHKTEPLSERTKIRWCSFFLWVLDFRLEKCW